jgi:VanZ family protein
MTIIFFFSSIPGGYWYYEPPAWLVVERKGAHVFEYAVLTLLSFQFLSLVFRKSLWRLLGVAMSFAIMYGTIDELHQVFTPFRGAHIKDVAIDTGGVFLMGIIIAGILIMRRRSAFGL